MSYGLHKAAGGIKKRRRETLAQLSTMTCKLHAGQPAAGLIETLLLDLIPACSVCVTYGKKHGYEVLEPPAGCEGVRDLFGGQCPDHDPI